jgi:hypothetical protein
MPGEGGEVMFAHGTAGKGAAGLHPAGRPLGRAEIKQRRIDLLRLAKQGKDVTNVMGDSERERSGLGCLSRHSCSGKRIVAGSNGGAGDRKAQA